MNSQGGIDCSDLLWSVPAAAQGTPTPGEKQGPLTGSGATAKEIPLDWPPNYNIPKSERDNFSGVIGPRVLKPGSVIYRVIGKGGYELGSYWAPAEPPLSEAQWKVEYAVFSW